MTRRRHPFAATLAALLFEHDPVGINMGHNTDEYDPEADSITARLPTATSEHDVLRIVHEKFTRWFGDSAGEAGRYPEIARQTWSRWQSRQT